MRIAIVGIGTESSTFSLDVTYKSFFTQLRGDVLLASYDFDTRFPEGLLDGVEFVPILNAAATAGGEVEPADFDALVEECIEGLKAAGELDGVYLDLHGATKVRGRDAAEEVFVAAVRAVVGPDMVLSASMDPHGNYSRELAEMIDLAASHRHAPHIDRRVTKDRAITNLVETIRRGEKPIRAWVRVPSLLPGERTSTVVEPGATVFGKQLPAIEKYGVLDANTWVGFAWADEPRNAAAVLVTGYDEANVVACARELAENYWNAREDFVIVSDHFGPWGEAMEFILSDAPTPIWISDAGDNVTAGATGDITLALTESLANEALMASGKRILFAGLVDAPTVAAAVEAGVGAVLDRAIGAVVDTRYAQPVAGSWTVLSIIDGLFGEGIVGALLTDGRVWVTVQTGRVYFVTPKDPAFVTWDVPGLAPVDTDDFDVVVVKNGYLFPGQAALATSAFMAITPGGTDLDFDRLRFDRWSRPMFPLDRDFEPDLAPVVL